MSLHTKIHGAFGRCCRSDFVTFDGSIDFKTDFSGFCATCISSKFNIFGSIEHKYESVWNHWILPVSRNETIFPTFKPVDALLINFLPQFRVTDMDENRVFINLVKEMFWG